MLNNSGLRVMGILQCTRAIGDKDLQPYGVIPTPDVLSLPRTGQEEFLVLATDGLWDVASNEVGWVQCRSWAWQGCFLQLHDHDPAPMVVPQLRQCLRCVPVGCRSILVA